MRFVFNPRLDLDLNLEVVAGLVVDFDHRISGR